MQLATLSLIYSFFPKNKFMVYTHATINIKFPLKNVRSLFYNIDLAIIIKYPDFFT